MPKITLPEDFMLPEGVGPGEEFEVLATVKLGDGGSAELIAFDGKPIPGYDSEEDESKDESGEGEGSESEPADGNPPGFVDSVMAQMGPMQ